MGNHGKLAVTAAMVFMVVMVMGLVGASTAEFTNSESASIETPTNGARQIAVSTTIQAAIDNASAGETVHIPPGTYNETVTIDKPIRLVGDPGSATPGVGSDAPVIDGGARSGVGITIQNNVSNVTITGVEITNFSGVGILGAGSNTSAIVIKNNHIHGILRQSRDFPGFGIATWLAEYETEHHSDWRVENNLIENTVSDAVQFTNLANGTIANNQIHGGNDILNTGENSTYGITASVYKDSLISKSIKFYNNSFTGTFTGRGGVINLHSSAFDESDIILTDVRIMNNTINEQSTYQTPTRGINIHLRGNTSTNEAILKNVTISGNVVVGVSSQGIGMGPNEKHVQLTNITIRDNVIQNAQGAINLEPKAQSTVSDVDVVANQANSTAHDSIVIQSGGSAEISDIEVRKNQITNGKAGITIRSFNQGLTKSLTVMNNSVTESQFGAYVNGIHDGEIKNAIFTGNNFAGNSATGLSSNAMNQSTVTDIHISANNLSNNGVRGIDFVGEPLGEHLNITVQENRISSNEDGLTIAPSQSGDEVVVSGNQITNNSHVGIQNLGSGILNATENFWGASSGPSSHDPANPVKDPVTGAVANGSGDTVSADVHFDPWLSVNPFAPPPIIGGQSPTDPDDDGTYEDITGDNQFNIIDVQALFANLQNTEVKDNAARFDFGGGGGVDIVDVQALFVELSNS